MTAANEGSLAEVMVTATANAILLALALSTSRSIHVGPSNNQWTLCVMAGFTLRRIAPSRPAVKIEMDFMLAMRQRGTERRERLQNGQSKSRASIVGGFGRRGPICITY